MIPSHALNFAHENMLMRASRLSRLREACLYINGVRRVEGMCIVLVHMYDGNIGIGIG